MRTIKLSYAIRWRECQLQVTIVICRAVSGKFKARDVVLRACSPFVGL